MESILSSNVPLSYLQALPTIDMNNNNNNVDNNINTVNNNNSNNAMYPPIVQPAGTKIPQPAPPKKRSSFTACAACQSKHCACDEQRPCSRCVRLRLQCTEGVPRKGKAKKKPQKDTSGGDFYVALERELLSGKYPSQFPPPSPSPVTPISSTPSVSSLPPPSPAYQMPSTPISSFPPPSPAYQMPSTPISSFPPPSPAPSFSQDSIPPSPALSFVDSDFSVSSALSAEDIETQLFLYESALPLPSPLVIPPPASSPSPSPSPSPSSSTPNLSSPSPLSSISSSDLEIGSTDPQFTTFLHSNTPVPHSFEKAIRHEHTNRMFAVSMMTSAMHPLQFVPNNNSNSNITELESGKNMSHNFTTSNNSPSSASSSSSPSSSFSSSSPTATLPGSPNNNNNNNNNSTNKNTNTNTNNTNNNPLNFCASSPFSPHFPIPDQTSNSANTPNSSNLSNPSNPSNPSNSSNSLNPSMAQLQQELADLRQELAAARYRERLAFPLQRRVRPQPRDAAMSLWSLHDGMLVDYSAGFMKLMKYTQDMLKSLSFYEISPPSTRAQRRHLHAFFIKEKPEINGVVSYKSLLNAEGRPIEVMCSASVFYFDDQVLLQLLCFNNQQ